MRKTLMGTLGIAVGMSAAACQTGYSPVGAAEAGLAAYVTAYLREEHKDAWDRTADYSLALADLNADGVEEALVHVRAGHCGTAGCGVLVFTREGQSWRLHSDVSSGHAPFRLLPTKSHGWRDIGAFVAGGGARPHEARLSFDGNTYPDNPYEAPPTGAAGETGGRVLIQRNGPGVPIFIHAASTARPAVDCATRDCPPM